MLPLQVEGFLFHLCLKKNKKIKKKKESRKGKIIQYLTDKLYWKSDKSLISFDDYIGCTESDKFTSDWQIFKFADGQGQKNM